MREAFWNGLSGVRWKEAPLGRRPSGWSGGCASAAMPGGRAGITGTPSFTSAGTCTKSWEATGFAMRGSSRISSPVICRGVAVTAARWADGKNRPAGAWRSCS